MAKYLPLPDGSSLEVPDSMTYDEAMARASQEFPALFGAKTTPKKGIMADVMGGAENLMNIGRTGLSALTGNTTEAAQAGTERQEKLAQKYESGFQPQKIADKWNQGEYLGAAGEALSQVPAAAASIAPSVGQEMGLAAAGRLGGGALGALAGPGGAAIGAQVGQYAVPAVVNFIQALGSEAQDKLAAQKAAGEKPDVNAMQLAPYAAANAALNLVGTNIAMPSVFKKAIGQKVEEEAGSAARKALLADATKVANRSTLYTIAKGIGGFAFGELPTEVLQDVVDRAAVGKPLADDDALKQYRDTTFNMLLASPLGGGFGIHQRAQARDTVAQDEAQQKVQALAAKQLEAHAAEMEANKPENLLALDAKYQEADAQMQQLRDAAKYPGKKATPEQMSAFEQAKDAAKTFKNEVFSPLEQEYGQRFEQIKQLKADQQAQEEARYQGVETAAAQNQPTSAAPVPNAAPTLNLPKLMEQHDTLQAQEEALRKQMREGGPEAFTQLEPQYTAVTTRMADLSKLIEQHGGTTETPERFEAQAKTSVEMIDKKIESANKAYAAALDENSSTGIPAAKKAAEQVRSLTKEREDLLKDLEARRQQLNEKVAGQQQRGQTRDLFTQEEAPIPTAETKEEAVSTAPVETEVIKEAPATALDTKTMDIFGHENQLRTAIANKDEATVNRMVSVDEQQKRESKNKTLDEERAANDRLMTALDKRLDLGGEEGTLKNVKRERMPLADENNKRLLRSGSHPDAALQKEWDEQGELAYDYNRVSEQVSELRKRVESKQGNAKKSVLQQLQELADEHAALNDQIESGIAKPLTSEKVAALQSKLGKGEAPAQRQMDASELFQAKRKRDAIAKRFNHLVDTKVKPVRTQIEKLHENLYSTTTPEKASVLKARQDAENLRRAQEKTATGRVPKSRAAATAARINAPEGSMINEAKKTQALEDLAQKIGIESPEYETLVNKQIKRIEALTKKYGKDDPAVSAYRIEVSDARMEQAREIGRKSPEYKKALVAQATKLKEAVAQTGEQKVQSKRTKQETRNTGISKTPDRTGSPESRAATEAKHLRVAGSKMSKKEVDLLIKEVQESTGFDNAVAETDAQQDALTAEGKEALADGRLLDTLKDIAKNSPHQFIRDNAEALIPFVSRTRIGLSPDIQVNGQDVPAAYSSTENAIGVRPGYETEYAVVHEATHAATMRALEGPEASLKPDQLAAKKELTGIFNALTKKGVLKGKYAAENVKEFASEVQSNVNLRKHLDEQKMFGSTALRRIVDTLLRLVGMKPSTFRTADAQAVIERLYMQSGKLEKVADAAVGFNKNAPRYESENALSAIADKIVAQPKTLKEKLGNNKALELEMQAVDMRAGLRDALKEGNQKNFEQAMYNVRKADQAMPITQAVLNQGPMVQKKDAKGFTYFESSGENSALDFFKKVQAVPGKNEQAKFALQQAYMAAIRANNKGLSKLDIGDLGLDQKDLDAAMKFVEDNPEYREPLEAARKAFNAYNKGNLEFLASTGRIPKKEAAELLKDEDYVPFYRVLGDGTVEFVLGEKTITVGDIRHQPYLAALKGGETKLLPLNESVIRNTMLLTRMALDNLSAKEVAYAFQALGEGNGPVDPRTGKATNLMAIKKGQAPEGKDIIKFYHEPDAKDPKDDGKRWIRVQTNGTPAEGIPAELAVRSLAGAQLTLPAFLKIGGFAGDMLRKGITRMPPYILRQLYRDPMAATFTGGLDYNPLTAVAKAGKQFISISKGESEAGAKLIKKGLIQSGIFTGDPDDMSAFALQLASGKNQGSLDRLLGMLDRAAMNADSATRALVLEQAEKQGLSEMQADMAVMESMNFHKRGLSPTVQYASRMIPFLNAQIQGLNVLYKAATGKMPYEQQQQIKQKFFNNAMSLFAAGFVYALAMDDDDTFKNAKPKDRYSNFFIPVTGVSEPLKIAIPYEAGWFFSAAVAAVDALKGKVDNKQQLTAIKDMFLGAVPGYSSAFMPQAIKPLYEVWTNKNFFSGQNIESLSMQGKSPEERYTTATTETAKALAKMLPGLSPIQIEYLTRAYFGTAPMLAMSAAGALFQKEGDVEKPEARLSQNAIFGSMFQRKFGGADADVVYKLAQEAKQAQVTLNGLKKSGAPSDIKDYMEDHRAELAAAPAAAKFSSAMSKLKLQEDLITNRSALSAAEKRARIDKIDEARQSIASQYMQTIKQIEDQF